MKDVLMWSVILNFVMAGIVVIFWYYGRAQEMVARELEKEIKRILDVVMHEQRLRTHVKQAEVEKEAEVIKRMEVLMTWERAETG